MTALVVGSALLASCSSDLDRPEAEALLRAHLIGIAPSAAGTIGSLTAGVVLKVDDFTREVRFSGFEEPVSATFRRSDEGWAVAAYGHELKRSVATLYATETFNEYKGPLQALRDVYLPLDRYWTYNNPIRLSQRSAETLTPVGPSTELAREVLESAQVSLPEGYSWGIAQGRNFFESAILWVRLSEDPDVVCGNRIGDGSLQPPSKYSFVGSGSDFGRYQSYCIGGRTRWRGRDTWGNIHRQLVATDGILIL